MGKPQAFRVTCCVCSAFEIVEPDRFWQAHIAMRQHVGTSHSEAEYDLYGEPVVRGYGWTDNYVAVLPLGTEEDVEKARHPTEELLKGSGTFFSGDGRARETGDGLER